MHEMLPPLTRHYGRFPEILPAEIASAVRAFRAHPAGEYALSLFRDQRRLPVRQSELGVSRTSPSP